MNWLIPQIKLEQITEKQERWHLSHKYYKSDIESIKVDFLLRAIKYCLKLYRYIVKMLFASLKLQKELMKRFFYAFAFFTHLFPLIGYGVDLQPNDIVAPQPGKYNVMMSYYATQNTNFYKNELM
jgi:hypothetical protein